MPEQPPPPVYAPDFRSKIPNFDLWKTSTEVIMRRRSAQMQALDDAIKRRDPNAIVTALNAWIAKEEREHQGDWEKSSRNKSKAISKLWHDIYGWRNTGARGGDESAALLYIAERRQQALRDQFMGKKLEFKAAHWAALRDMTTTKFAKFQATAPVVVNTALAAHNLRNLGTGLQSLVDALKLGQGSTLVELGFGYGSMPSFPLAALPFLGTIISAGSAANMWRNVASMAWNRRGLDANRIAIARDGDPERALDAVRDLLIHEIHETEVRASVQTANFVAQAGLLAADGGVVSGPAISALQLIFEIVFAIVGYMRDKEEMAYANALMARGVYDWTLFRHSPLLGCYFLLMQDHSTILSITLAQYGTARWQDDVERLMPKIEQILKVARLLLSKSRFEIRQFSGEIQVAKGILGEKRGRLDRFALWVRKKAEDYVPPAGIPEERQKANNEWSEELKNFYQAFG
jgi:hypothetical protein